MHQTPSVSGRTGMTVVVLSPTARLPPIKTLNTAPIELLHEALQYLQTIYNPEIRTSRRINHGSAPRTSTEPIYDYDYDYDAGSNDDKAVGDIRTDAFEHAYAVRWLTALVAQTTLRSDVDTDADANADDTVQPDLLEPLIQSAAALLAVCAGAASAGTRTRTYVLCGVRVQLTDVALRNDDFGSVGAQTWGSACVLAEMIAEAPARFGLWCGDGDGQRGASSLLSDGRRPCVGASAIRVLELGAGTGLVSLTIGKVLEAAAGSPSSSCCCCETCRVEIVASDFYSRALENLRLNIQRNFPRVPRLERDDDVVLILILRRRRATCRFAHIFSTGSKLRTPRARSRRRLTHRLTRCLVRTSCMSWSTPHGSTHASSASSARLVAFIL
jgi:hypothetical protein